MKIYIGWDSKQQEASEVCEYSIRKHTEEHVDIRHLKTQELKEAGCYFRPEGSPSSTEFTYSRFLVPYLQDYKGWAMFVDSDFLFTEDMAYLWDRVLGTINVQDYSVFVSKHPEYVPKSNKKFYNKPQLTFPKKNWSSLILYNCNHPDVKNLTPMTVANMSPQWLHRFEWTDDSKIGHIPLMWNWLVGEYDGGDPVPFGLHFTNGGPFNNVWGQDYEEIWIKYQNEMLNFRA